MTERADFDALWNYGDPAGTEQQFRALLPAAEAAGDRSYLAQLLTQIARAQGLQGKFDEAHATLDRIEPMLSDEAPLPRVRYLLERGRAFNSAGRAAEALPLFREAADLAEDAELDRYAIDAVHMLAIAEPDPAEQVWLNLEALDIVTDRPAQHGWRYALYNNLGESYAKLGQYEQALDAFEKLAAHLRDRGKEEDIFNLKDQARMLRLLGRVDRAMAIIGPVHERLDENGEPDGWISEEYAECLLASGDADAARPHFKVALELLSSDRWVIANEPAKLERLKQLAR